MQPLYSIRTRTIVGIALGNQQFFQKIIAEFTGWRISNLLGIYFNFTYFAP